MRNDTIPISSLNDFLFCPYSLYLHMVYRDTEEEAAKAVPQKAGTFAHQKVAVTSSFTFANVKELTYFCIINCSV